MELLEIVELLTDELPLPYTFGTAGENLTIFCEIFSLESGEKNNGKLSSEGLDRRRGNYLKKKYIKSFLYKR